jgi:hypothetical protein
MNDSNHNKNLEVEMITLCTFKPRTVYDEILEKGVYRLSKSDFLKEYNSRKQYEPFHILDKYERLIEYSGLDIMNGTGMPIWAWHKNENGEIVTPETFKNALEAPRTQISGEKYVEMVGLFLQVPRKEVFLTNFVNWDFYLFSERNTTDIDNYDNWSQEEQGWYQACIAEENYYFSKLNEIEGEVKVQAIFPEIRKEMITFLLEEEKTIPIPRVS